MVRGGRGKWDLFHFWRKAVRGEEGASTSAAGEGGQEGDLVAVADGGVPFDEFVVDGGLDDVGGQGDFPVGLDFMKELARGFRLGLIAVGPGAAGRAHQGEISDGEILFHPWSVGWGHNIN